MCLCVCLRSVHEYVVCLQAQFLSYSAAEGEWTFLVEHFSKYGLLDDDEEDKEVVEEEGGGLPSSSAGASMDEDGEEDEVEEDCAEDTPSTELLRPQPHRLPVCGILHSCCSPPFSGLSGLASMWLMLPLTFVHPSTPSAVLCGVGPGGCSGGGRGCC